MDRLCGPRFYLGGFPTRAGCVDRLCEPGFYLGSFPTKAGCLDRRFHTQKGAVLGYLVPD